MYKLISLVFSSYSILKYLWRLLYITWFDFYALPIDIFWDLSSNQTAPTPQLLSPHSGTQLLAAPASFPVENVLLLSPLLTTWSSWEWSKIETNNLYDPSPTSSCKNIHSLFSLQRVWCHSSYLRLSWVQDISRNSLISFFRFP